MASFGPVAPHYDLLMSQVPYEMWADYYRLLLSQVGAEPNHLLDVCCGTGTVAEILCLNGFRVTGFDLSPEMIEVAKARADKWPDKLDFFVADACGLEVSERFDGAYSFFDSLNYIVEPERLSMAIERTAAHLHEGSTFVFDLNTGYAFEQKMFDQRDMKQKSEINYQWHGDYDKRSRVIRVQMEFWVEGRHFQEVHYQKAHSDEEVREACDCAGLVVLNAYDSYTLDPPRRTSDRVHYVARKP